MIRSPVRVRCLARCHGLIATAAVLLLSGCAQFNDLVTPPAPDLPLTPEVEAALAAVDPAYVIGPEDLIDITVWRDETLKTTALVRPDGGLSFPLVGEVSVVGKTATQVRDELTERLDKYMPEPVVTVAVSRVASQRIYVLGRVNKPGDYVVGRPVDVLQALTLAGGMTPFAVEDGIRVIRRVNGKSVAIPFQYSRVRRGSDLSQNITLRSGDLLLVP